LEIHVDWRCRGFSTSNPAQAREANFYEILDVPTTASAAEIKKYAHIERA
jgi:hypothetical protein